MTVRIYKSTDASAPVLTGQVGKLTDLLDAVLVNGYGALTAAGWTIAYTATNKRAYLQNLTGANNASGMHLYVDDNGPGAGAAKEARACGFETMSAITPTGTGQFPTAAQSAIGTGQLAIRKSNTADATARPWTIIANGQSVYIFIETGDNVAPVLGAFPFIFGDFEPYKSGDQYAVCIIGRNIENTGTAANEPFPIVNSGNIAAGYGLNNTMFGHFIARNWAGTGGSVRCGKVIDISKQFNANTQVAIGGWNGEASTTAAGGANIAMGRTWNIANVQWPSPNGPDGSIWVSPIFLNHSFALRGYLSGLWAPLHDRPLNHNDTVTVGAGNLNGKSLICMQIPAYINTGANSDNGEVFVEYSDTWT